MTSWCCLFTLQGAKATGISNILVQQARLLSIHEHLAMNLLQENGVQVPKYEVANSPDETFKIAEEFGN